MGKKKVSDIGNEAFVSVGPKTPLHGNENSLSETSLTSDEICTIFDFYVSHAPILDNSIKSDFGLRNLKDYGWKSTELTELERRLLRESGMDKIVIKLSKTIKQTLHENDLENEICLDTPRSVVLQNATVSLEESGKTKIERKETRLMCFFRHIRNSLAHNRIYYFKEVDMILLEDMDGTKITARILIKVHTLFDWISIIDKEHKFYFKDNKEGLDKTA